MALGAAVILGLLALASNVTTDSQVSGQADLLKAVRLTLSKLVNSGTAWAGLVVVAGWLVRRPVHSAAAGIAAALTALVVHYGAGQLLGMYESSIWSSNAFWFAVALVAGAPLGLIGTLAHHHGRWGLLARLVVPFGAVVEPFVVGYFTLPDVLPWPTRVSSIVSGAILCAAGAAAAIAVAVQQIRGKWRGGWPLAARPESSASSEG